MMNIFIQHIILAARNRGDNDWMNILFLVFVMILYAVSGLVKKVKDQKITFGEGEKPHKTSPPAGAGQKPAGIKPHRQEFKLPSLTSDKRRMRKISLGQAAGRAVSSVTDMYKRAVKLSEVGFELKGTREGIKFDEDKETISRTQTKAELTKAEPLAFEKPEEKEIIEHFAAEQLVSLEEPGDFRRAFLYYEIFGRPLSMRRETGVPGLSP